MKLGNIVDLSGNVLGSHNGLYRYTIGQRKGLGISNQVPLFVVGFNKEKNELIVGEEKDLYKTNFYVSDFNLLVDNFPSKLDVKIRYSSKFAKATLVIEDSNIHVILDEPQKSITPGQSAVFYDNDIVIGGGKINVTI